MEEKLDDALKATLAAQGLDGSIDGRQTIDASRINTELATPGGGLAAAAGLSFDTNGLTVDSDDLSGLVVLSELGRGGMGVVLLAQQRALGREVAVKRSTQSGDAVQALVREARIMGQLEHPNVIPVHQLLADDEGPAVVMKRVGSASWEDALGVGDSPELDRHLEIFLQLCNAVAFAHSRGVVHRDIKPDNVLLGEYGEVYLADWGLARAVEAPPTDRISGSPAYMAPEMLCDVADERTDVYLLGATLYQVLCGQPLHAGNLTKALESVRRSDPVVLPASVPADLTAICARACDSDPAKRFAEVNELQTAVRAHLRLRSTRSLLRTAAIRAGQVQPGADRAVVDLAFTEARFGFDQAIGELKPIVANADDAVRAHLQGELDTALEERDRTLRAMVRIELQHRQPAAALALLAAMDQPPPDLKAEANALQVEVSSERERLSKLEADRDPQVGAADRSWAQLLLAVGILALTLIFAVALAPRRDPSPLRLAIVGGVVFVVIGAVTLIWRHRGTWNLLNRRIAQISMLASGVSALQRLVALSTGVDSVHVLLTDAFVLGMAGMALTPFHRAGPVLTLLSLGVIGVGLVQPTLVDELFVGFAVGVPAVLLLAQLTRYMNMGTR